MKAQHTLPSNQLEATSLALGYSAKTFSLPATMHGQSKFSTTSMIPMTGLWNNHRRPKNMTLEQIIKSGCPIYVSIHLGGYAERVQVSITDALRVMKDYLKESFGDANSLFNSEFEAVCTYFPQTSTHPAELFLGK
jgi:hypothetical protein